jgi:hypothetical protein
MSTWRATPGTRTADAAADRLLAAAAAAWALADRLHAAGDRANGCAAEALGDAVLQGAPPARLHYAALALGVDHAQAVAWVEDGTLPLAPWAGQFRVELVDIAFLARRRTAAQRLRPVA